MTLLLTLLLLTISIEANETKEKIAISIFYDSSYREFSTDFIEKLKRSFRGKVERIHAVEKSDLSNPKRLAAISEELPPIVVTIGNTPVRLFFKLRHKKFVLISLFFNEKSRPERPNFFYISPFLTADAKLNLIESHLSGVKSVVFFSTPNIPVSKKEFIDRRNIFVENISEGSQIFSALKKRSASGDPTLFVMPEDNLLEYSPGVIRKFIKETINRQVVFFGFRKEYARYGFLMNYHIPSMSYIQALLIQIQKIRFRQIPEKIVMPEHFLYVNEKLLNEANISITNRGYKLKKVSNL